MEFGVAASVVTDSLGADVEAGTVVRGGSVLEAPPDVALGRLGTEGSEALSVQAASARQNSRLTMNKRLIEQTLPAACGV